jgi:hypothetical protein
VRHYRTALYSLWTALDGKDAANPLRDVKPARSDDPVDQMRAGSAARFEVDHVLSIVRHPRPLTLSSMGVPVDPEVGVISKD